MPVFNNILAGAAGQSGGAAADFRIQRSLRFDSSSGSYLNKTFSSAGNRNTWTLSWWMKRSKLSNNFQTIFGVCDASATYYTQLRFGNTDKLGYHEKGSANGLVFETDMVFRDTSAWYHCVFVFNNTASSNNEKARLYVNGTEITSFSTDNRSQIGTTPTAWNNNVQHNISHMRPYSGSGQYGFDFDGYLAEVNFVDGQALAPTDFGEFDTATTGVWNPIEYTGTYGTNGFHLDFSDNSSNAALGTDSSGNSNTWTVNNLTATTVNYNSTLTAVDSSQTITNPGNAFDNSTSTSIGGITGGIKFTPPGGSQSNVTSLRFYSQSFGQGGTIKLNGTLIESNYDFGNGGWYAFSSAVLSNSNNNNTLTSFEWNRQPGQGGNNSDYLFGIEINGTVLVNTGNEDIDSLLDSPTNYEASSGNNGGNHATLNPLNYRTSTTLSNGNLQLASSANYRSGVATIALVGGKYYFEGRILTDSNNGYSQIGITLNPDGQTYPGANGSQDGFGWYGGSNGSGQLYYENSVRETYSGWTVGDVVSVAYDSATRKCWIAKNGTWQNSGNPATGAGSVYTIPGTAIPYFSISTGTGGVVAANFGQRPFAISSVPTGFKSLCTQNLPDPLIANGSDYFDVITRDGLGSSGGNVPGLSFSPDLVWEKARNTTSDHYLMDTVRGATKDLRSNLTQAENTNANYLTVFNSDGYTVGSGDWSTSTTVVSWAWDAGSSNTSISAGSLNSSAYDQSQTWSSMLSAETSGSVSGPTYAFDSTPGNTSSTSARTSPTSTQGGIIFTPTGGYTVTSQIRVYGGSSTDECFLDFGSGYGSAITLTSGAWNTVYTGSGTLSNLKVKDPDGANATGLGGIEIDGKLLIDSGVTPAVNVPSIASTTRANPTAGFSIVSVPSVDDTNTIRTAGSGLNAEPEFIISKNRDFDDAWFVYHKDIQTNNKQRIYLNSSAGVNSSSSQIWQHTSSVIGFNGAQYVAQGNTDNLIFYCWSGVENFSRFGSYVGTGDSPNFVYLGFRPACVIIKNTVSNNWVIYDSTRDTYNVISDSIAPDTDGTEVDQVSNYGIDLLSNGFALRTTGSYLATTNNASEGHTYIYGAWAEAPLKYSRAR